MDNKSVGTFSRLADSALIIAGGSLWLYLVVSAHARGFFTYFSAEPEWFSPSIFQLVSFSSTSIVLAVALAGAYYYLAFAQDSGLLRWWLVYFAWIAVVIVVQLLAGAGVALNQLNSNRSVVTPIAVTVVLVVTPGWSRWLRGRAARWREGIEMRLQSDDVSVRTAAEAELDATLKRWSIFAGLPDWFSPVFLAVITAAMLLSFAETLGTGQAMLAAARSRFLSVSADDPTRSIAVVFTDGASSLVREWNGKKMRVLFYRPNGQPTLELRTPAEADVEKIGWELEEIKREREELKATTQSAKLAAPSTTHK